MWIQIEYVIWPRMVSWNRSVLTCSIICKDKIMVIIQLVWLRSTKLNKLLIILMTVISICLLIFQSSGDDAALAKMLKVIRFLVGHLVHLVKVKICSSLSLFCWHYVGSLRYIFLLLNESLVHSNYYCLVLIYLICSVVFFLFFFLFWIGIWWILWQVLREYSSFSSDHTKVRVTVLPRLFLLFRYQSHTLALTKG